jgi:hypothetical protein
MPSQYFRITTDTIGVRLERYGKQVAVTIPAGATVAVSAPVPLERAADPNRCIHVVWEDRTISLFLTDLQDRGLRVTSALA